MGGTSVESEISVQSASGVMAALEVLGYPAIRFRIEPGEGVRLPAAGLFVAGCTLDKGEPDILLLVR